MFLLSPNMHKATWMEAPLPNNGFKWWIAWLSPSNLTTMWGENGQLIQSKIIATDQVDEKLQVKLAEKLGKGYRELATYDNARHLWTENPGEKLPAFPPTAHPAAYYECDDFQINLRRDGLTKERLVLKKVRGSFLQLGDAFRLEHYINKPNLVSMTYPTWQTLFTSVDDAIAIVRDVVGRRQASGMDATGDINRLISLVPLEIVHAPGTLVWDF